MSETYFGYDPPFAMESSTAHELGLTNSEWMRHNWTGELPDRISALDQITYRQQTAREPQSPAGPKPAFTEIKIFKDHDEFKSWTLREVEELTDHMRQGLANPELLLHEELLRRAACVRASYDNSTYKYSWQETMDKQLPAAFAGLYSLTSSVFEAPNLSLAARTDLLDAIGQLGWEQVDPAKEVVGHIAAGLGSAIGIRVCSKLLDRQTITGDLIVEAINNRIFQESTEHLVLLAGNLLSPLARHLQHKAQTRFYHAQGTLNSMSLILDTLDSSAKLMAAAQTAGLDLAETANIIAATCIAKKKDFDKGEVATHAMTASMIALLDRLYFPQHSPHTQLPAELGPFLQFLYEFKFKRYQHIREVKETTLAFNKLAKACNLQERIG